MSLLRFLPWVLVAAALAEGWRLRRRLAAGQRDAVRLAETAAGLRRISQAVESTSDAVGIGDLDGRALYHNRAHVELLGYTPAELNARPGPGVLFADPDVAAAILAAVRSGRSWHGETDLLTKIGRVVPVLVRANLIRDEAGRPAGIYAVFDDMTEERKRRQEAARTSRLESLGLFAGGIAHDFNNLLTAMQGNLDLAKMEPTLAPVVRLRLELVGKIVARAGQLTNGLKAFAQDGQISKRPTPLPPLMREAAELAVQGTAVALEWRLPADLLPVDADPGQLGQVLHNLVLNAVQAMPAGGQVTLSAGNLAAGGDPAIRVGERWVKLAVADTGPGMSPEMQAKIFDPFFTTKQRGTGLGLATAHSIIAQHGGHLRVESAAGQGTTFVILLPAGRVESVATASAKAA